MVTETFCHLRASHVAFRSRNASEPIYGRFETYWSNMGFYGRNRGILTRRGIRMKPRSGIWLIKERQDNRLDLSDEVIPRRRHKKSPTVYHSSGMSNKEEYLKSLSYKDSVFCLHNEFRL